MDAPAATPVTAMLKLLASAGYVKVAGTAATPGALESRLTVRLAVGTGLKTRVRSDDVPATIVGA